MTVRTPALLTAVSALAGASLLFGTVVPPVAHAEDPLARIKAAVNGDRSRTACPAFTYSQVLEDAAQKMVRYSSPSTWGTPAGYHGRTQSFYGFGDPEVQAISDAYESGATALIPDCSYTEFGVGFIRSDGSGSDTVGIFFGAPTKVAPPPPVTAPTPDPEATLAPTPAVQHCSAGSPTPTVPAFGTCAPVPPPTDEVSVSFVRGGASWTVNVANAANIAGKCAYRANGPAGALGNRSFDIAPNGSASFQVPAPLPFVTYHVVTSCHGTFNGTDVEFGHDEQEVSA